MVNYFKILIIVSCLSCQNSTSKQMESDKGRDSFETVSVSKKLFVNNQDTTSFLSQCENWSSGAFEGYLQGIKSSKDSLGSFCFYECYDCAKTFEIIFVYKGERGKDSDNIIWKEFEGGCSNQYNNFNL